VHGRACERARAQRASPEPGEERIPLRRLWNREPGDDSDDKSKGSDHDHRPQRDPDCEWHAPLSLHVRSDSKRGEISVPHRRPPRRVAFECPDCGYLTRVVVPGGGKAPCSGIDHGRRSRHVPLVAPAICKRLWLCRRAQKLVGPSDMILMALCSSRTGSRSPCFANITIVCARVSAAGSL
jgi:hypothetical protein